MKGRQRRVLMESQQEERRNPDFDDGEPCDWTPQKKIGMCCYCGDQLPTIRKILVQGGLELCRRCAEQAGFEEAE